MIPNDFADRRHLISESRQANQNCHITAQEEVGVREFGISSSVKLFILASSIRYQKMVEWMDNVEMAIQKVCASKVYTSAEFKREKDNFQSLCKNLERAETKKWLNETLETLMKVSFEFASF